MGFCLIRIALFRNQFSQPPAEHLTHGGHGPWPARLLVGRHGPRGLRNRRQQTHSY
ncbi:hypothetical protein BDP81DRAFT_424414 [Colletotrichum phormii]|uniref:Uncharacterized protein n=1 Tax=Colletotrichum phormii TaxID=359342 RepID=A0AAI9ZUP3_9PEZI|nr:uncharacterized protein BDP81DRAFT_424414 [Colletotrichum phormii]KAK1638190.1 hypothetical protein BDP81DRAFT_424414 [Colletotrichum phormii]